jgi:hypothetical protein
MKRASLTDVANKSMAEKKEAFIHGDTSKPLKGNRGIAVKGDTVKKASCYIPITLWLQYKTFELEQVRKGHPVSLNGLINELLADKLKNYQG